MRIGLFLKSDQEVLKWSENRFPIYGEELTCMILSHFYCVQRTKVVILLLSLDVYSSKVFLYTDRQMVLWKSMDNYPKITPVRPSLKNCMFAVLLPIIFEVGR